MDGDKSVAERGNCRESYSLSAPETKSSESSLQLSAIAAAGLGSGAEESCDFEAVMSRIGGNVNLLQRLVDLFSVTGSSSRMIVGLVAMARAISRRRRLAYESTEAGWLRR